MGVETSEYAQSSYDKVADDYDRLWSQRVRAPNDRLTRGLDLKRGERVADLACGTALFTLEMARLVEPGEVVGVDYSEGMLSAARDRALAEGISLRLVHARAEDFVSHAEPGSFDAVSFRFALAYVDWREILPRLGRLVCHGGRVGVLTSLSSSIPQALWLYERFRGSFLETWKASKRSRRPLAEVFKLYRELRKVYGEPHFIAVPDSAESVSRLLARGGLKSREVWTDRIRLWFGSGCEAVEWLRESGYSTHPSLQHVGPQAMEFGASLFAAGLETLREPKGVPIDLVIGGVVAERA